MSGWAYVASGIYTHPIWGRVWCHQSGNHSSWYRRTRKGLVFGPYQTLDIVKVAAQRNLPPFACTVPVCVLDAYLANVCKILERTSNEEETLGIVIGHGIDQPFAEWLVRRAATTINHVEEFEFACVECGSATVRPLHGGLQAKYCSAQCRCKASNRNRRAA
jgi:hypothetical protein